MVYNDELLIALDAGHGGTDPGAVWEGRLEKNDNLRLAQAVQRQLLAQGIPVLMTRDADVYVSLADRVAMANGAGADLFVSLHRNSYIEQTPYTNGVENFIYLTAAEETTGRAAQYVLDQVVNVGVQSNRGVNRGNYYVLRRTIMPAMLLEMGFIINEIDNTLFDSHLEEYAAAIARGIMEYFNLEFKEIPGVTPPLPPGTGTCPPGCVPAPETPPELPTPELTPCPICPDAGVMETQLIVGQRFGIDIPLTGVLDTATIRGATMALQMALNSDFNAGLVVDGFLGPKTLAAFPMVRLGQQGNLVFVIQALLRLNSYDPGPLDGIFGTQTQTAVRMFQQEHSLSPDGVVGGSTLSSLLRA